MRNKPTRKNEGVNRHSVNDIDHPLVVDTADTRKKIAWPPHPQFSLLTRRPVLMNNFTSQRYRWEERNIRPNEAKYEYAPDNMN